LRVRDDDLRVQEDVELERAVILGSKQNRIQSHHSSLISPNPNLTALPRADHTLLLRKQSLFRKCTIPIHASLPPPFKEAMAATLVLAQQEAGTAVYIHSSEEILTCAHCIAETRDDRGPNNLK
jgi:hypothetical protein